MILPSHILEKMDPSQRAKLGKAGITAAEAQAKFVARSERDIQSQICNWLNLQGIAFYRAAMNKKTTGRVGWPDFTFAVSGFACALEVKFGPGKLRPEQESTITAMGKNGWRVAVVRSLEEAIEFIKEVGA